MESFRTEEIASTSTFVANVRDFYTVVFGCGEGSSNTQGYLLFLLDRCRDVQNANPRCTGHATMSTERANERPITAHAHFLAIAPNQNATLQFVLCTIDPQC